MIKSHIENAIRSGSTLGIITNYNSIRSRIKELATHCTFADTNDLIDDDDIPIWILMHLCDTSKLMETRTIDYDDMDIISRDDDLMHILSTNIVQINGRAYRDNHLGGTIYTLIADAYVRILLTIMILISIGATITCIPAISSYESTIQSMLHMIVIIINTFVILYRYVRSVPYYTAIYTVTTIIVASIAIISNVLSILHIDYFVTTILSTLNFIIGCANLSLMIIMQWNDKYILMVPTRRYEHLI